MHPLSTTLTEEDDDDGDDDEGGGGSDSDDDKYSKNKSLNLQNGMKHWPDYLRPTASQKHSEDDVHPSEAGPRDPESSAIK